MSHPRVRLVPATEALLDALNNDRSVFAEMVGSTIPDGWPEFPEAIDSTRNHLSTAAEHDRAWSMRFFLDEATSRLVGSGGFAGPPAGRTVEIGYEVAPEFRGRGFGAAAARALVEDAAASGEVDHVIAHTLPGPNPSTRVLARLGFERIADEDDPEVGVVWAWRRASSAPSGTVASALTSPTPHDVRTGRWGRAKVCVPRPTMSAVIRNVTRRPPMR
ncbi:GNAT family protein [Nocardioides aestuarii]|uniref:GNAT family protein n=1 Tax=Nocardioides aestuarii TaxID=252231 RepID=A0ABW4TS32_9ACTN